jgi:hypothetical protein
MYFSMRASVFCTIFSPSFFVLCPFSSFYKASRRVKKSFFAATSAIVLKLYEYLLQFTKGSNNYADAM